MNRSIQHALGHKDRDWQEDFSKENGQYVNVCIKCDKTFIGYKRRIVCKACSNVPPVTP